MDNLEQRFNEKFMCQEHPLSSACQFKHPPTGHLRQDLLDFINEELEKALDVAYQDSCKGVSQWRNYGKKRGYWKYFLREILESMPTYEGCTSNACMRSGDQCTCSPDIEEWKASLIN